MSEPDTVEQIAEKIRTYAYKHGNSDVERALQHLMPQVGPFSRWEVSDGVFNYITKNEEATLEDRIRDVVKLRHTPGYVSAFAYQLMCWHDEHKSGPKAKPGSARVTNAEPAPAAPVIRGEGGMAQDNDDDVVVDMPAVAVIHPPKPGENIGDEDVVFVGTMDERSAAVVSAQEQAKLAALVPSDAEMAEYARRKNQVDARDLEAQVREYERLEQQARRQRAEEKLQRSREAVARALELVRIKEAELQRANHAMVRATDMFEADERDLQELERAAKRPRGGA
jgi:hypothetical protein